MIYRSSPRGVCFGYLFSANGASFNLRLGQRPKIHSKESAALKARFTSRASCTDSARLNCAFSAGCPVI